jgi:hypothetical protein
MVENSVGVTGTMTFIVPLGNESIRMEELTQAHVEAYKARILPTDDLVKQVYRDGWFASMGKRQKQLAERSLKLNKALRKIATCECRTPSYCPLHDEKCVVCIAQEALK